MTKHGRLIDAEWLKESLHNFFTGNFHKINEDDIMAYIDAAPTIEAKDAGFEQPEQKEPCWACEGLEDGDTLYAHSDWDGGIGFDYIRDIKYCPVCGRRLNG